MNIFWNFFAPATKWIWIIEVENVKYFGYALERRMEEICLFFSKSEAAPSSGHLLHHAKMIHLVNLLSIYWFNHENVNVIVDCVSLMNLFYSTRDLRSFVANWLMLRFTCFCVKFLLLKLRSHNFFWQISCLFHEWQTLIWPRIWLEIKLSE